MKKNKSGIKKNIAGGSNMRRARQGAVVPMIKGGIVKMAGGGIGMSKSGVEVANSKNNLWLHQVQKTLS